jgi:hypothetical protein
LTKDFLPTFLGQFFIVFYDFKEGYQPINGSGKKDTSRNPS